MNAENGSFFEDSASTSQSLDKQAAKRRAKIKHSDGLRTGELSGRMWRLGENEDRASRRKPVIDLFYKAQPSPQDDTKEKDKETSKKGKIKEAQRKADKNLKDPPKKEPSPKAKESLPKKAKEPPELHKKEESLSKKRKESPNKKASTSKQEVTSKKKKEESLASVRQQISDKQNFDSPTQTVTKKVAHNPIIELSFIQPNALKDEIVKSGSVISPDEVIVVAQLASPISNRKSSQFAAKKMTSESNISLIGENEKLNVSNICSNCNKVSVWSNAKFCGFCGTLI